MSDTAIDFTVAAPMIQIIWLFLLFICFCFVVSTKISTSWEHSFHESSGFYVLAMYGDIWLDILETESKKLEMNLKSVQNV